jgi:hypothetical protein
LYDVSHCGVLPYCYAFSCRNTLLKQRQVSSPGPASNQQQEQQQQLQAQQQHVRAVVVGWMTEVAVAFRLTSATLFLAVELLDCYLVKQVRQVVLKTHVGMPSRVGRNLFASYCGMRWDCWDQVS